MKDQSDPFRNLWIIVPAYNESERIERTLIGLKAAGYRNIIVVDDGSTDNTSISASKCDVWILRHLINRGQGAALATGISFAKSKAADVVVTFDSDGQHDANEIAGLVQPILKDEADVVLGSRFLGETQGMPTSRRWILKLATVFTRLTTGLAVTDTHNGFRAFSEKSLSKIQIFEDRMAHASEILSKIAKSDVRWQEQAVTIRYTEDSLAKGQSNLDALKIVMRLIVARLVG